MTTVSTARSFSEKLGLLGELALFAGLSEADMQAIGHATSMTHCVRGQLILSPDDPPDRIHILKKGRVRVYREFGHTLLGTGQIMEFGVLAPERLVAAA